MIGTKVLEIFSHEIVIPVEGITLIVFLMISDILSGIFKAIATGRGINSTVGTNGLIRKAGVLLALLVFIVVDSLVELNLVSIIPQEVLDVFQLDQVRIGLSSIMLCFFGLFELSSLFENLGEVGVPLPNFITKFIERLKVTLEGEE
ncbi:phage holin family protein [Turicibacter sanguinis]|jgi:toxin secretion/phage lysis holin|uniref:phage holin family protein n=1 Tax=Turicibacter sanguinis TaxID=154288 RepID=UPI0018996CC4|nr:phage holin family protein [Turicibacter sanguinis]MDB8556727.1 phage holin family protein [Turicibacter sanguinis]